MSRSMLGDHLPEVLAQVRRLRGRFAQTAPRSWGPVTAASELSVQLGHLALCLLRHRGSDVSGVEDPQRHITKVGDELGTPPSLPEAAGTVLTACETLAEQLGVNLLDEFRSMVVDADEFLDNRSDVS